MKKKTVRHNGSKRLILIYAGWGMDWRPFADLYHPDYDIVVVWDYRDLTFNWKPFFEYDEICLIAWSMGVFAASVTLHEIAPRVTMRIAVNGTLTPIDDHLGIPPAIWHGTLNGLSPATWRKFTRRMCNSAQHYAEFSLNAPKRTLADLKEELEELETQTIFHTEQITDWDLAIVSTHDAIFPAQNQLEAWKDVAPMRMLDSGHLPDFDAIVRRLVIDKSKVAERFGNARESYGANAVVQRDIAHRLMNIFDGVFGTGPIIGNVIEVGAGTDAFLTGLWFGRTDRRAQRCLWDLTDISADRIPEGAVFAKCDAEVAIKRQPSDSVGFIFSSSTLQWFNSQREFLKECCRVLAPGGWLVFSAFEQGNLEEATSVTGNALQLPTLGGWKKLIPEGMEILAVESEIQRISFETPREVLEHFRDTGVNGVFYGKSSTVIARRLLENYPRDPRTGRYNVSYHPIYIVARKFSE